MKKILILTTILSLFFGLNAFGEMKEYKSPFYKYTIEYPQTWTMGSQPGVEYFLSPQESTSDTFRENVNVVVEQIRGISITLEEYDKASFQVLSMQIPGFQLIDRGKTKIDRRDAIYIVYNSLQNKLKLKHKAYIILVDSIGYNLTYTSAIKDFDRFLLQAENIMRSIKIAPK